MARRRLACILLLAAALHAWGIARASLPAQDGLKFLRVARAFGREPWDAVVRGSDQHPLYPALIALAHPMVGALVGGGPDSWRIAAQVVSALASTLLLLPLLALGRDLFDERVGLAAAALWAVLPFPAEVGRDTLADPLALLAFATALWLGLRALRGRSVAPALLCGLAAGVGYLARPEVAVAPVAVLAAAAPELLRRRPIRTAGLPRFAALGVAFLACVGGYAMVKGELSEKLAIRRAAALGSRHDRPREVAHVLPPGLDDPRWSFEPKEESGAPGRLSLVEATARLAAGWAEGLGWLLVPFALIGAVRVRPRVGGGLMAVYLALFSALLVRHAMTLGYLSGRHSLTLVIVALPWAAAGLFAAGRRVADWCRMDGARRPRAGRLALAVVLASGVVAQAKPSHPSRWGHRAAGHWLASHAGEGDAVLDTRGWAAFASGLRSYDYWHVRQAFTDARLAFVVVGADELRAESRRAETLRAVLAYACEPAAAFPAREGGSTEDVRIYRYRRPESWEGLGR
jgi:hypothetical protein